jgi:hypothetical protein
MLRIGARRTRMTNLAVGAFFFGCAVVVGCAGDVGGGNDASDETSSDDAAVNDAAPDAIGDAAEGATACNTLGLGNMANVSMNQLAGPPADSPQGGAFSDGTYKLYELDGYNVTSPVSPNPAVRETLVMKGGVAQIVMQEQGGPVVAVTVQITQQGSTLSMQITCGAPATGMLGNLVGGFDGNAAITAATGVTQQYTVKVFRTSNGVVYESAFVAN